MVFDQFSNGKDEVSLFQLKTSALLNFKRYDIDGQNVQLYFDQVIQKIYFGCMSGRFELKY